MKNEMNHREKSSTWFEIDPNKRLRGILNRRDAHVSESTV